MKCHFLPLYLLFLQAMAIVRAVVFKVSIIAHALSINDLDMVILVKVNYDGGVKEFPVISLHLLR